MTLYWPASYSVLVHAPHVCVHSIIFLHVVRLGARRYGEWHLQRVYLKVGTCAIPDYYYNRCTLIIWESYVYDTLMYILVIHIKRIEVNALFNCVGQDIALYATM